MYDPIFIGPYKSGIVQYYKPYAIGNDAFTNLVNAYSWRGVIKKRQGSTILARLPQWSPSGATINSITNASPPVVTTSSDHGLLTGDMVWLEVAKTTNGSINTITPGQTTVITTSGTHGMNAAQTVYISGITGTIGTILNGNTFYVLSTTTNTITLNVETTGLAYTSGGTVYVGGLNLTSFQITKTGSSTFTLQDLSGANVGPFGAAQSANMYLPVVGTRTYYVTSSSVSFAGDEQLIMFHPKQAFLLNTSTFPATVTNISFNSLGNALLWTGTRDSFIYSSNYYAALWTTNNVDNIRFFNGSTIAGWDNLVPIVSGTTTMTQALLVLPYKGRLIALYTTEGGTVYANRARWSQIGTPFAGAAAPLSISSISNATTAVVTTTTNHNLNSDQIVSFLYVTGTNASSFNSINFTVTVTGATTFTIPLNTSALSYTTTNAIVQQMSATTGVAGNDINAWRSDLPGKGGFIDADTSEQIVSAQIVQDTLIVGFQFSTWRLSFTGNQVQPFIWERINTQFGSEATFSSVGFDDAVLLISRRGIIASTFNDADRIDMIVPDIISTFQVTPSPVGANNNFVPLNRVQGIRDYENRLVYWIFGSTTNSNYTPNQILCYNYEDKTWAFFNQSFTCLGSFKITQNNVWSTWTTIWDGDTSTWQDSVDQKSIPVICAGAQDSNVWRIMQSDVSTDNGNSYGFSITTNYINPYFKQGKRSKLAFYDLYATSTSNGQVTVQYMQNDNDQDVVLSQTVKTYLTEDTAYFRVFLNGIARSHQINITLTPAQIADPNIGPSPFELQAVIMHMSPQGRIKQ